MNDSGMDMRLFIVLLCTKGVIIALVSSATELSPSLIGPKNTIGVVGGRTELKCNINNETMKVSWEFFSFGGAQQETIYYGDDIIEIQISKYRINKTMPGQHDLIIDHVDMMHSGRYQCSSGNQIKTSAEFSVLISDPHCEADSGDRGLKENKTLRLQCKVTYMGNLIPVFVWTKEDKEYEPVTTTYNGTGPTTITSKLMKQLNRSDNGAIFSSKVTFQFPNKSEVYVPNYIFAWSHKADVLYGPRNIKIESNSSSLKYRDHLECSADGNPIPTYKWTLNGTDIIPGGPLLTLSFSLSVNKNYTFICTAVNDVASDSKAITICIYLTMKDTEELGSISKGTIAAIIVCVIVTIVVAALCFWRTCVKDFIRGKFSCFQRNPDIFPTSEVNIFGANTHPQFIQDSAAYSEFHLGGNELLPYFKSESHSLAPRNCAPAYTEVKKKKMKNGNMANCTETFDIEENETASEIPQRRYNKQINQVEDKVEYTLLSCDPRFKVRNVPSKLPVFSKVDTYASIDHSIKTPPPPPRL